jgi:hypothetical protein
LALAVLGALAVATLAVSLAESVFVGRLQQLGRAKQVEVHCKQENYMLSTFDLVLAFAKRVCFGSLILTPANTPAFTSIRHLSAFYILLGIKVLHSLFVQFYLFSFFGGTL